MTQRSEKHEAVRNSLPENLRESFDHLVGDYKFLCAKRCGYRGIAYDVIADLIRYGWRLDPSLAISDDIKPGLKGEWLVVVSTRLGIETYREHNVFNDAGRILIHHCPGGIVDEGPEGADPKTVYKNIAKVQFTDEILKDEDHPKGIRICRLTKNE